MATRISFARLEDGAWGVRVQGDARDLSGTVVTVTKRDGSTRQARLGEAVKRTTFKNRLTIIYALAGERGKPKPGVKPYTRDEADYMAGVAEVSQIQAISAPGSALREALYMEMEMRNYNLGLD